MNAEFDHPEAESYIACLELPAATLGPKEAEKENATPNAEFDHPEAESYIACLELPAATSDPEEVEKENATPNVQNNSNATLKEAFFEEISSVPSKDKSVEDEEKW